MEKELFDKAVKLNNDITFLQKKIEALKLMNGEENEISIVLRCGENTVKISGKYENLEDNVENYMIYFLRPIIQQEFEKRLESLEYEFKELS
jgi:hypothetical protein